MDSSGFETLTAVMSHLAHDLSNLLTPVLTYPSLVRSDLPDGCLGHDLLDAIEKTANDMAHITVQLQHLATRDKEDREEVDVNTVVREVGVELQTNGISPEVVVEVDLADGLPLVNACVDDVVAAVDNVARNAVEAAAPTGRVSLRTGCTDLPDGAGVCGAPSPAGKFVSIEVTDDGAGIAEDLAKDVFEPFVTTKSAHARRGSGLGLAIVHKIMREHEGRIDLTSVPGEGTTVALHFRVLEASA